MLQPIALVTVTAGFLSFNKADTASFLAATFECIDIIKRRAEYDLNHSNPLRKMSNVLIENAADEAIETTDE